MDAADRARFVESLAIGLSPDDDRTITSDEFEVVWRRRARRACGGSIVAGGA